MDVEFLERAFGEVFGVFDEENRDPATWVEKGMWEYSLKSLPAHRANLHRRSLGYTETMYISAFPAAKMIVVACEPVRMRLGHEMPGVIRHLPLGWRDMRDAEAMRSRFEKTVESYLDSGWIRTAHR